MRRIVLSTLLSAALVAGAACAPALAAGRWSTFARPYRYTDLLAVGDTIWCGTLETGLLRFLRSDGSFEVNSKQPNGLASNQVTALAMDRSERLWVGTQGSGVSRLERDRTTWTLVNTFDGLPSNSITVLRAQGDTLWIGTQGGIAIWDGLEVAGRLPDGVNPSPFASDEVSGLAVRGDSLWVATGSGIYVSRISTYLANWASADSGLGPNVVSALAWDGTSLIALAGGDPYLFDEASGTWLLRGGIGYVQRVADDRNVIVASSTWGLYRWSGTAWTGVTAELASDACPANDPDCPGLFAVGVDESGRLSAADRDGLRLQPSGGGSWTLFTPPGPPSNNITNVELDRDWTYVSTFGDGMGRFDGKDWRLWLPVACTTGCDTIVQNPSYVFCILRDRDGRKWTGGWGGPLDVFDDRVDPPSFVHLWIHTPADPSDAPHTWTWASAVDSNGGHWFGMDTPRYDDPTNYPALGLEYYDSLGAYTANYSSSTYPDIRNNRIHGLTVDKANTVWVGFTPGGLARFSPPNRDDTTHAITIRAVPGGRTPGLFVQALGAHGDDIWVLTSSGVLRLDRTNPNTDAQAGFYELPGSLEQFGGRAMDVGPDGRAWAGTSGGVRVFEPDGSFEDFNTLNSPLVNDLVRAIRVDQSTGVVWIGTAGGLSRYDPNYVPPAPEPPARLELKLWPNPGLLTGAGVALHLAGNVPSFRGSVYDVTGRRLRDFSGTNGQVFWDGRDDDGTLVRPGVYLVRVVASGRATTLRVALLR